MNAAKIKLPAPSAVLLERLEIFVANIKLSHDGKHWLDKFHDRKINTALHYFVGEPWLHDALRSEFGEYFPKHNIMGAVGIMKNASDKLACMPPHTDKTRSMAVNYFVSLGGSNVETVFYDQTHPATGTSINILYDDLQVLERYVVAEPGWHIMRTDRAHSVENIESMRLFLAIRPIRKNINNYLDLEYGFDDFCKDYPDLLSAC